MDRQPLDLGHRDLNLLQPMQVVVDGFLSIPSFPVGKDRVALIQDRPIPCLPHPEQLRVWPCPFDAVPTSESSWWHPICDDDPEHRWTPGDG